LFIVFLSLFLVYWDRLIGQIAECVTIVRMWEIGAILFVKIYIAENWKC